VSRCAVPEPHYVIFPQISGQGKHAISPLSQQESIQTLLSQSLLYGQKTVMSEHFFLLTQLVQRVHLYRLYVGDSPITLVDCLEEILL